MSEQEKYLEVLKKRAIGYEYEEVQTLIEETPNGTKKKIVKTKKHIPADIETAKWFLKQLEKTKDFNKLIEEFEEDLKGVIYENSKN